MSQGHSAAWDQRWDLAEQHYREALEYSPDALQALNSLGLALYEQGKHEDALTYYLRAAGLRPDDPIAVEKVAETYQMLGDKKEAIRYSMQAADLYLKVRDVDKALENWTRVVQISPADLAARTRLAMVHERLKHTSQAINEYLAIASLLQHEGRLQDANKTVNHAIGLDPRNEKARQALELIQAHKSLPRPRAEGLVTEQLLPLQEGAALVDGGQAPDAEPKTSPAPLTEAREKALSKLASLLFGPSDEPSGEGKQEAAPQTLTGMLSLEIANSEKIIHSLSGAIELQTKGEIDEAADKLKQAIEAGLEHPAAFFNYGCLLMEAGRVESGQRNLTRALGHRDYALAARLLMADHLYQSGQIVEAAEQYMEALRVADTSLAPSDGADALDERYEQLIKAHLDAGDEEQLANICKIISDLLKRPNWRVHLEKARGQLPERIEGEAPLSLLELLSEAQSSEVVDALNEINQLARDGYFRSAMERAYYVLPKAPTYLPLHRKMGELLHHQNQDQKAIAKFTAVAQAYGARSQPERAVKMMRRVVELSPLDVAARDRLVAQLIERGEIQQALTELRALAEVQYRLAELGAARQTYERALRLAQEADAGQAWIVGILSGMADIDMQRLDWRQAVRVYEQLRTLQPDDERVRALLIDLNLRLGQEGQAQVELDNYLSYLVGVARDTQAIEFLEKTVAEYPKLAFARRRLAAAYQQATRVDEAIKQWDKVGEMLLEGGDREGAKEALRAIIALNPPNAPRYRALLKKLEG